MAVCPQCQTPLPEPIPDFCPSCGAALGAIAPPPAPPPLPPPDAGERAVAPPPPLPGGGGAGAGGGPAPGTAWDARDRIGFAAAFVETTRQVLLSPQSFFRGMPVAGGVGSPLLYAVIAGWAGIAAAALYQAIWMSIVGAASIPFGMDRPEFAQVFAFLESWAGLGAQVVFGGISVVISVFVVAGILHLMLMLLGGARRGFEATFRVVAFSQATALLFVIPLFLIPFCGLLVVAWSLVLHVIGLSEAHQIGRGQALAAVLLPLVALCCCCAGLAFALAGAIASLTGHAP